MGDPREWSSISGDFRYRVTVQVMQFDGVPLIAGKSFQCVSEADRSFVSQGILARRCLVRGQLFDTRGGLVQRLADRLLSRGIALLATEMTDSVSEFVRQNFSQPRFKLGAGGPAELGQGHVRLQQGLLHHVGRIHLVRHRSPSSKVDSSQHKEVTPIPLRPEFVCRFRCHRAPLRYQDGKRTETDHGFP